MSQSVQNFLNSFNRLDKSEQLQITTEILKQTLHLDFPPLTDEELAQNAEELFLELEQQEIEDELKPAETERKSFLKYAGQWKGEDAQECLEKVYTSRGLTEF